MKIQLKQPVAGNMSVDEFDVRQIKGALNRLGYYTPYEKTGMTGIPDADMFAALKAFQNERGLQDTGVIKPDDETAKALNAAVSKTPEGQYIWRSVGDGKVRDSHADFNGTVRSWSDDPDPTEEFNCRCWAEAVSVPVLQKKPEQNGEPEGLKQVVISSLQQSSYQWTKEDFKHHFWHGNGQDVTLSEIGWLVEIIWHAQKTMFHRVEKQIADKARQVQLGSFSDTWERSYDFEEVVFSIGNAVIKGRFNGTVRKNGDILHVDAKAYYLLDDEFTDPWSIRQTVLGSSDPDILWDNPIGNVTLQTTDLLFGKRYSITGTWMTKVNGIIKLTN